MRFRSLVVLPLLLPACAPAREVSPPLASGAPESTRTYAAPDVPRAALERLVDSVFAAAMPEERIPGAVFILVQRGQVVLAKGYGVSDVAARTPVSPDSTLWRIGSISKVMTATGVVQLADRGAIRLDGDVNQYLRRLQVPATFPEAVTPRHLLTHTAGLDELAGRNAASREAVVPLHEFLRERLVRVRPPGRVIAYSSFGPALSGALIEEVSGLSFDAYLQRNVWAPLGMHDTNVTPPSGVLPTGYGVQGDSVVSATWEWSNTAPAGQINSTATDMGRFMSFMLGHHPQAPRVLSDPARRSMLTRQIATHPRVPGMGLGFQEDRVNGHTLWEHGGDIDGYASWLVLLPEAEIGFFVASHREGAQLRSKLKDALLDRFFPPAAGTAAARRISGVELSRFVGGYRWNIFCRTCRNPWLPGIARVAANGDSTLTFIDETWVPVEPLLFQSRDGRRTLGFASDSVGRILQVTLGGTKVMERVAD
jgi:CubicO group peptidase (beta-lactamase class C family)